MASIRRRGKKYQVQVRLQDASPKSKTFVKRSDAQRWAFETERAISFGIPVATRQVATFHDLLNRYSETIVPTMKGQKQERSLCQRVDAKFGKLKVSEITASLLSEYRDTRIAEVSPQTVKHEISCVRRVLRIAQAEWGIWLPQGIPAVRMPKLPAGRKRRISDKEESRLLDALPDPVKEVVCFALDTAMRRSEILELAHDDLRLADRTCIVGDPKNGRTRVVPLTRRAASIVAAKQGNSSLFEIRPDSVTQAFRRACKRLDIDDLRFHDLRHEAISRLFEKGLSVPQVAAISGHQDYRMLARYVHLHMFELE